MKQTNLINSFLNDLIQYNLIDACFIGGSFGRDKNNNFSNIDLYILLLEDISSRYQKIKFELLEKYDVISYDKMLTQPKPIEIIVFHDGCILKIHYLNKDHIIELDINQKILYDPKHLLKQTNENQNKMTEEEIGELVDNLALQSLEFYRNYLNNEYPICLHLLSDIHYQYSIIKHYVKDEENARLGSKEIMNCFNQVERKKYIEIIRNYSFDKMKECIQLILNDLYEDLIQMPISIASRFNIDFFEFVKSKTMEL